MFPASCVEAIYDQKKVRQGENTLYTNITFFVCFSACTKVASPSTAKKTTSRSGKKVIFTIQGPTYTAENGMHNY